MLLQLVSCLIFLIAIFSYWIFCPPQRDDIPTIPLYINFLSIFRNEGRIVFFRNHLKQHLDRTGIVRTFLAGKWSLMVSDPELLAEMFKKERIISKAGFRRKAPQGMLAALFGNNIIDAHGEDWKRFVHYMKPGFQDKQADYEQLQALSRKLTKALFAMQSKKPEGGIVYDDLIRRWAWAVTGEHFLAFDFQTMEDPNAPLVKMMDDVQRMLPTPLLSLFPRLEWFDWLRPWRREKWKVVDTLHTYLLDLAAQRKLDEGDNPAAFRRHANVLDGLIRAKTEGQMSQDEFLGNIATTFIAGHENVLSLIKSAIWEIARRPELQAALREEAFRYSEATRVREGVDELPLLAAVVLETGRLYPPILQLAGRVALQPTTLGGRYNIHAGQWMGWNAYAVQTNPRVWGPDALEFKPERWGTSSASEIEKMHQRCQNNCTYIVFNAHARKCLGRSFALLQTKTVLLEMLKEMEWSVDPTYTFQTIGRSIFTPLNAKVIFKPSGRGVKRSKPTGIACP